MKKTLPTAPSNRAVFYTKTLLVFLFCIGFSKATHAQVATTYAFSQTDTGLTYVPITGGTVYATATFPTTFVDTAPASVALGFTFTFNGANYTNVTITDNGYVTFGGTLPLATDYTPISSSTTFNGAISGFSQNLRSASNNAAYITPNPNITSTVRYQTIGLAPNRIFVVQYEDVVRTTRTGLLNFQILLYEGTNVIEILYNTFNPNTPTGLAGLANGQVGLRGATSADFNNRLLTTTNWTATQPGITNGDVIILRGTSPATFNADVTRFRWTPSNCLAPTALTAVLLGDNSTANFSWTAPIIPPAGGYDWEVRTAGNPGTGGAFASGNTASTSVAIPGLQVGTTYYFYVKSNCSSTWLPVNVAPSTITLTPVCAIATIPYTQNFESVTAPAIPACNSTVTPTGPAFATVDNTSANFFGFNNKNLTTVGDIAKNCWYFTQAIDFPAAGDYRLSYKYGGTRQQTFFQQKMRVFYGSVASVAGMTTQLADHPDIKNSPLTNVINFTVTTPGTYYIGFYGYANATNGSLQLDDISVAVSSCRPPTALTVPPAQITSNSALVSWTPPSSAPSEGYQYFLSTSNTSPVNTTTPTGTVAPGVTVVSLSGLNSSTTYYVWVRSNCGGSDVSSWSSVASFFTLFQPTYCLPSGNGNPQDPNGIINVTMGTINNTTGIELNNYGNYSNLSTNVIRGTTIPTSITFGTGFTYNTNIWVDWNNDGDFDDAGESVYTGESAAPNPSTLNASFAVPIGQPLGTIRLRIGSIDSPTFTGGALTPCRIGAYQAFEDYTIKVIDAPPALTISGVSTAICSGDTSSNISITSPLSNFDVYSWSPTSGVNLVSPGVYNFNPTTSTTYVLTGTQTSGSFLSNVVNYTVTVKPTPTPIVVTPASATICQNATTTQLLSATGGIISGAIVSGVSENFNSGPGGYTTVNNSTNTSTGPAISPLAAWTLRNSPFTTTTAPQTISSNDNSQYYMSDSDLQGFDGSTRTELISPVFDLSTYSDASLSFWHFYRAWSNGSARVQISTNGGSTYTDLVTYTTTTVGGANSFANQILSLNAYTGMGMNNLRLRFFYSTNFGYRWAVDNVVVSGTSTSNVTWTPPANLFTDAAGLVSYTAGTPASNVYVKTTGSASLSFTASATGAGCTVNTVVPVTVTPVSGGAPSPLTQLIACTAAAANITITGFSGTVTKWQYSSSPTFASGIVDIPGSNSPTLLSAQIGTLSATRYYRAEVTNGSCVHYSTIASISINSATWNGTIWSNGTGPSNTISAEFQGNYSSAANLNACSVLVTSGNVIFNVGHTFTVQTNVRVLGGSLTFEDESSLYQVQDVANGVGVFSGGNTGNINYRRVTTPLFRFDYTYWSTPVHPQTLIAVSPLTPFSLFYEYNSGINNWQYINPTNTMIPAKGYIFRAPNNYPPGLPDLTPAQPYTAPFSGVPNNGTITLPVAGGASQLNLLGNPYPSALSADAFLLDPANAATLSGTIYLWTHNTPISNNIYTGSDYAIYNYMGGTVGGEPTVAATNPGVNNEIPNGKIASGQGFFIKGLSSGVATFKNSMRIAGNNDQFFRMSSNSTTTSTPEKHRYWLEISNTQGAFKQVLVGYVDDATLGLDRLYDGEMVDVGNVVTLYTLVDDTKLTIQGRPTFAVTDTVPLGYKSTIVGSYSIHLSMFDGLFETQNVYLEDTLLGVIHDLRQSDYTFTTEIGSFDTRFVLRYTTESLGTDNPIFNENTVVVYKNQQGLHVSSGNVMMENVTIFDIRGRQIAVQKHVGDTETVFTTLPSTQQVLLVKITSVDGVVVTKKVVY